MERLRTRIDLILERCLMVIMAVLTIDVLWQVVARYVLSSPSSWTEELARFLLIWVSLLGAAYLTGKRAHIAIDVLPRRLVGISRRRIDLLIHCIVGLFAFLVLFVGGLNLVRVTLTLGQESPALHIPLGYVYLVLPLSGLLIMYYAAYDIAIPRTKPTDTTD